MKKMMNNLRIICAALYFPELDLIFYGHRHNHCLQAANDQILWNMNKQEMHKLTKIQGFVASDGQFYTRDEAFLIAKEAGQIKENRVLDQNRKNLFTEDIY